MRGSCDCTQDGPVWRCSLQCRCVKPSSLEHAIILHFVILSAWSKKPYLLFRPESYRSARDTSSFMYRNVNERQTTLQRTANDAATNGKRNAMNGKRGDNVRTAIYPYFVFQTSTNINLVFTYTPKPRSGHSSFVYLPISGCITETK